MSVPIILIPGIKGTNLVNTNTLDFDTIYSGVQSKIETVYDLELQEDSRFEVSRRSLIERSDVEDLAYQEFVSVIRSKTKSPVYIFGYDWRKSCRENGRKLKQYVDYLTEKLGEEKFNFVTHSMGGMIFSCFLKELNLNYGIVNRVAITVCPYLGSINALIALIVGEGGINFPLFNSNDDARKIARTFPSVYEITPHYEGAIKFEGGGDIDLYDKTHWQANIVNELFSKRLDELRDFRVDNPAMLDLNELPKEVQDRIIILVGRGENTKSGVIVKEKNPNGGKIRNYFDFNQLEDKDGVNQLEDKDGDGTVHYKSSTIYKEVITTLAVESKWYDKATHAFFLKDGRVQTVIKRFFNKEEAGFEKWWGDVSGSVNQVE